ncbi:MAG: cation:proton antiporter [Planctomycetaceae bacterium]|nr:cation:proton antiporter [Planctomycetaceae bacterium]
MEISFLKEHHIFLFLVQVFILLLATRGLGELFRKWDQPPLTAELLVGIVLGPTILGRFLPGVQAAIFPPDEIQRAMLETVAWIGILFMLLETGLEIDFSVAWRQRGNALTISMSDVFIPMIIAFVPCLFLPSRYLMAEHQRLIFALFMATIMTISDMPLTARTLHDLNLLKADVGFLIMSALAVNDIVGWVLFTIILALFTQNDPQFGSMLLIFAATIGFAVLALTVGRSVSSKSLNRLKQINSPEPATSLTFAVLLGLLFGAITQRLGIHSLFGFFIAGVVMGEAKGMSEDTRVVISQMVYAIFVPLFFANIGLKIDFAANFNLFLAVFLTALGIFGRYIGAWVGIGLSTVPYANRHLISIAHTPGGMMAIVVALLAYESRIITGEVFVAVVLSSVVSSIAIGPWMRQAMRTRAALRTAIYLRPEAVLPAMSAQSRQDAIFELAAIAASQIGPETRQSIADAALKRESDFGTAIGNAIAIPHVRIETVKRPVLVFGRCEADLDWDAPDGRPVHMIFFLVTPAGIHDVHVQVLAAIARAFQKLENRRIIEQANADALYMVLRKLLAQADEDRRQK